MWIVIAFHNSCKPSTKWQRNLVCQALSGKGLQALCLSLTYFSQTLWRQSPLQFLSCMAFGRPHSCRLYLFECWIFTRPFGPMSVSHEISPNGSSALDFWNSSELQFLKLAGTCRKGLTLPWLLLFLFWRLSDALSLWASQFITFNEHKIHQDIKIK